MRILAGDAWNDVAAACVPGPEHPVPGGDEPRLLESLLGPLLVHRHDHLAVAVDRVAQRTKSEIHASAEEVTLFMICENDDPLERFLHVLLTPEKHSIHHVGNATVDLGDLHRSLHVFIVEETDAVAMRHRPAKLHGGNQAKLDNPCHVTVNLLCVLI